LKIPKGSEAVNRRRKENTMAKRKMTTRQPMVDKTLNRKRLSNTNPTKRPG